MAPPPSLAFFFFNDTATTEIYTLSLHDALPISRPSRRTWLGAFPPEYAGESRPVPVPDRKSTRLNSSHLVISYAVFCLKKKNIRRPYRARSRSSLCPVVSPLPGSRDVPSSTRTY